MSDLTKHVLLPSIAPLAIVALYFTPKEVFGCANRGYLALAVVFVATLAALATGVRAGLERRHRSDTSLWWLVTTLILILPLALVAGPLG